MSIGGAAYRDVIPKLGIEAHRDFTKVYIFENNTVTCTNLISRTIVLKKICLEIA